MDPANPATNKQIALRVVLLFVLVILSSYLFFYYDLHVFFKDKNRIIDFIKSSPYDEIVFILLQITQVVAAPIPGELTGFIGGYIYGPFLGTIYSTIGLTLGSWLAFILAHFFGMPLLEKVVKPAVIEKFDHFMEHQGILVSFFLFLIPGFPKDYLSYLMGVSRMPFWMFLIISSAGRLLGTIMLSVTGSSARNGNYFLLGCFVGAGIIVFILAYYFQDRLLELLKKKSKKPAAPK
ncbi:MAG TPA: VTT domain-containing protein [Smithellaceae bacterium]|nr:VTT domain-containing protein [Smithellaceae bacterium]